LRGVLVFTIVIEALQSADAAPYRARMSTSHEIHFRYRWLSAAGSVLAGTAVALSAYATHAAQGQERASLYIAAALAFGHGIALAALAPRSRVHFIALCGMLLGTLLFSGSLVMHDAFHISVRLAPFGGSVLILSWLLHAAATLRR
jgi:uncharacterized membrane protein YgdD (TMEM256/DUF423 family)